MRAVFARHLADLKKIRKKNRRRQESTARKEFFVWRSRVAREPAESINKILFDDFSFPTPSSLLAQYFRFSFFLIISAVALRHEKKLHSGSWCVRKHQEENQNVKKKKKREKVQKIVNFLPSWYCLEFREDERGSSSLFSAIESHQSMSVRLVMSRRASQITTQN